MSETKIGLGLAALGRPEYINIRPETEVDKSEKSFRDNAFEVLNFAYQHGIRHFDTAPSYGKGEQFLLDWNTKYAHEDVQLSTKWGYTYQANWELGFQGAHEVKEHSLEKLVEQWQVSKKLSPALKIYQVHSATFESGILENKGVLEKLHQIKERKGLQIGLTTSGANQGEILETALKIKVENEFLFSSFQVTYNILEQSTNDALRKILKQGKTIIVKEALANGRVFKNEKNPYYQQLYSVLEKLCLKYKVGIDAIALRFIMDFLQPNIVLSGASNTVQLKQNLESYKFQLTNKEISQLQSMAVNPNDYWIERNSLTWN